MAKGLVCGGVTMFFGFIVLLTGILAATWFFLWRRDRSAKKTEKIMLETYRIMRSQYPGETEEGILHKMIRLRYPGWEDEKITDFVRGVPNVNVLIHQVMYYESDTRSGLDAGEDGDRIKGAMMISKGRDEARRCKIAPPALRSAPEEKIGMVTRYYPHLGVAVIKLMHGQVRVGDTLHLKGPKADLRQKIESMEYENRFLKRATPGQAFAVKIKGDVRVHDNVYKVIEKSRAA
jgi:hypothetical protein